MPPSCKAIVFSYYQMCCSEARDEWLPSLEFHPDLTPVYRENTKEIYEKWQNGHYFLNSANLKYDFSATNENFIMKLINYTQFCELYLLEWFLKFYSIHFDFNLNSDHKSYFRLNSDLNLNELFSF